uniref:Uncharacterized protein n=1 Tax=Podarcis muralis TaxID=64176 RepID=A0A670HY94_PODMU
MGAVPDCRLDTTRSRPPAIGGVQLGYFGGFYSRRVPGHPLAMALVPLAWLASVDLALQWGLWAAAAALRTEKFFDLAGSGTFILLAHLSLRWGNTQHLRQQVQTGLVTIWGLRLGLFLFLRILKEGHDRRFNGVREHSGTFFLYWTMQGIWVFVTLLPTLLLNLEKHQKPLGFWDYFGWSIWAVGFVTEAVADQQKWHFRSNPDNAGKFIQSGPMGLQPSPQLPGRDLAVDRTFCVGHPSTTWLAILQRHLTAAGVVLAQFYQWDSNPRKSSHEEMGERGGVSGLLAEDSRAVAYQLEVIRETLFGTLNTKKL